MKHPGSILHFTHQRNAELMRAYRHACRHRSFIAINDIAIEIVNSPSSRFWVSEERALVVISNILKGRPILDTMHPSKQEMFREIYRRTLLLLEQNTSLALSDAVFQAVNSPAPKFYMRPRCAIEIIRKIRKSNKT